MSTPFLRFLTEDIESQYNFQSDRGNGKQEVGYNNLHDFWYVKTKYGLVSATLYSTVDSVEKGVSGVVKIAAHGPKDIGGVQISTPDKSTAIKVNGESTELEIWYKVPSGKLMKNGTNVKWGSSVSYVEPKSGEAEVQAEMQKIAVAFWDFLVKGIAPHKQKKDTTIEASYFTSDGKEFSISQTDAQKNGIVWRNFYDAQKASTLAGGLEYSNRNPDKHVILIIPTKDTAKLLIKFLQKHTEINKVMLWLMTPSGRAVKGRVPPSDWPFTDNPTEIGREELFKTLKTLSK